MSDTAQLKKLAMAATPGPWKSTENDELHVGVVAPWSETVSPKTQPGLGDFRGIHVCEIIHQNDNPCVSKAQAVANMEFIAAANPAAVLELIADRDQLLAEKEQWMEIQRSHLTATEEAHRQCAELLAQNGRLREALEVLTEWACNYVGIVDAAKTIFGEIRSASEALSETPAASLAEIGRVTELGVVWNKNGNPHDNL